MSKQIIKDGQILLVEIKQMIEEARHNAKKAINSELTILNWNIGKTIQQKIKGKKQDKYGKAIIENLSEALTNTYGKGWSTQQLWHCTRFYETFKDREKLYTLCRELSWSHLRTLMYIEDELKRYFYIELATLERWSVRLLQDRIKSMLFERTALSKKPELTIQHDLEELRNNKKVSEDIVFRDPYVLDFLGLSDTYSEYDLESAILNELERFLIELGADFAFLARQKRIVIDKKDYYIDLLFYHRRLKCLVAIDLKIGEFDAAYKGQMELYLRYLEKYDRIEGENLPIGLILCTGKNEEHVELLQLDQSNIRVAEYLTQLPAKDVFREQLHLAIERARKRLKK